MDFVGEGIRPVVEMDRCVSCTECLDVCPAFENDHTKINRRLGAMPELTQYCGPVLEIWEGHAADREIRFTGASGGVITALALYCLEKEAMHGVLHIGMDPQDALRNRTRLSRSRAELLSNAGSRYAPASACDSLCLIESAPAPCVFIGQPAEVTALRKAEQLRPALGQKVGLAISFFCAGSPATRGTFDLLKKMGVKPDEVQDLRYRGRGWPGLFSATLKGQSKLALQMSYQESWGFVQAYRPFSTHLAPDGTGEDADIACGDPWYREIAGDEPGSSLVLVRTEVGRRLLRGAMEAGYVTLTPAASWKLIALAKKPDGQTRRDWRAGGDDEVAGASGSTAARLLAVQELAEIELGGETAFHHRHPPPDHHAPLPSPASLEGVGRRKQAIVLQTKKHS